MDLIPVANPWKKDLAIDAVKILIDTLKMSCLTWSAIFHSEVSNGIFAARQLVPMTRPTTGQSFSLIRIPKNLTKLFQSALEKLVLGHPPHRTSIITDKVDSGLELNDVVLNVVVMKLHEREQTK